MTIDKSQFIADFIQEARENLDAIDDYAIQITKDDRNSGLMEGLLRELHTLKGSARMMEFTQIEKIVNTLETLFKNIQSNQTEIPLRCAQLLMGVGVQIRKSIDRIEKNEAYELANYELILSNILKAADGEDYLIDFENRETGGTGDAGEIGAAADAVNGDYFRDSQTIKVQVSQIDNILQSLDKLIMRQIKLKNDLDAIKDLPSSSEFTSGSFNSLRELSENVGVLERQSMDIQKNIIALRMLPFDMILLPIKRSIVAEALKAGKNIDFDIPHSEITIDKAILEKLPAILMHLVRNALDHGIEPSEERKKNGKSEKGHVSIEVSQVSSRIFVTVKDDGSGIDYRKIKEKALRVFPEREKEILTASEDDLLQFIFMSGFSTKDKQTELSGRGIGLDVVRSEIDKLKGKISVYSEPGKGTAFELSLPASLATQDGLFVQVSNRSYLILSHYIKEIITVSKSSFLRMQHGPVLNVHNMLIPVYDFDILNPNGEKSISTEDETPVVVIEYLNKKICVMVDKILHYSTVVIKPLPPILKNFNALQGIVFDENYQIIPVLNIPDTMQRFKAINIYDVKNLEVQKAQKIYSVLVVDDSHTTRHIEQVIFEADNYKVTTACDGIDALELMKQHRFDLVVTDVRMPRMDGFILIHNMRHKPELKDIPVIVVSSVFESDTAEKVKSLGAQAYIVKSDFERENLINKARELLNGK